MFLDLGSLWLVSIPLTLLAARVFHLPFLGVVITAYLGEDIPKSLLCLWHFVSMRWLKPVTEEGREGLRLYRGEEEYAPLALRNLFRYTSAKKCE